MTYTQERIDAFAQLDAAIDVLRKACGHDGDMLTGWALITSSIELTRPTDDPDDDDLDVKSSGMIYGKRGQDPTLTYGILTDALRHWNAITEDE